MRPQLLALGVAGAFAIILAACGGGGSKPPAPPAPLTITTQLVATATVNIVYNFFIQASGGAGTYSWALTKGSLPPGLRLDSGFGEITGTATTFGVYSFTVQVTDGVGGILSGPLPGGNRLGEPAWRGRQHQQARRGEAAERIVARPSR